MNLSDIAKMYKKLSAYKIEIHSNSPMSPMIIDFRIENFHHLCGFQHISDKNHIKNPRGGNKKDFFNKIYNNAPHYIDPILESSFFKNKYSDKNNNVIGISIEERINLFKLVPWALLNDYCSRMTVNNSRIQSDYLLNFDYNDKSIILHLCTTEEENILVPMSLTYEDNHHIERNRTLKSFKVNVKIERK